MEDCFPVKLMSTELKKDFELEAVRYFNTEEAVV